MKKMVFTMAMLLMGVAAMAQNYIVVNSEKVFKSIAAYNTAIEELDALAEQYQGYVDAKFEEVEKLYNSYQQQKASLSESTRQQWEAVILQKEQEATQYQEQLFARYIAEEREKHPTWSDEEVRADVLRSLREGMATGRSYVFSTSNCAYTGLPLQRYEMMNDLWRQYGNYDTYEKNFG